MLTNRGGRVAARLTYARLLARSGSVPSPRDAAAVRSGRADADRILLFGNGAAHGWGVVSHQLALTGALGRSITAVTRRACDVDFIGDELMNIASAVSWLGDRSLLDYEGVVVVAGMNDAVCLTPLDVWERSLRELLGTMRGRMNPLARIQVTGIQPVASVPMYTGAYASRGQRHADRLNEITQRVLAETDRAAYLPFPAAVSDPGRSIGSPAIYQEWAALIANRVAPDLDALRELQSDRPARFDAPVAFEWPGTAAALRFAPDGGSPELLRLVNAAKVEFGATLACVMLKDADQLWFAARSARTPTSIPLGLAYCDVVLSSDAPLTVSDSSKNPEFANNPFLNLAHLPFYAGHPLHSTDGTPIGTFCVLGATARPASSVPADALRRYALAAESELHRIDAESTHDARPDASVDTVVDTAE